MRARPNSVPRLRTTSTDPFDAKFQSKGSEGVRRTSVGTSPNMRKASFTTSIVDDLSSIFGASSSSVEFQEVEGDSEDRRRARLERHQRTLERAEKALAEKNEWDNQTQRDQEERHMFIEEVMNLVELNPLREALVGLPGVTGLSTEQRKWLTIAMELVANPSIIFMDEPTSGLDARAAAIVMRTMRNTVDTGRTVVCTTHMKKISQTFYEIWWKGEIIYNIKGC